MDTECSNAQPNSTTTRIASPDKLHRPKPQRASSVYHFFRVKDAAVAEELGVQVRYLCGRWGFPGATATRIQKNGSVDDEVRRTDCKRCVKALTARGMQLVRTAPQ
jgi:hypothetical protein